MNCQYCQKEINNKGGLVKHENGCKLNLNRTVYKSNFEIHNARVKSGKSAVHNQWTKAKESGESVKLSKETRKKLGNSRRNKPLTSEHKEKLSLARSKQIEECGNGGFKNVKWYTVNNINGDNFIVRGTWELRVAELLNVNSILWIRKIYLSYEDGPISRTYTPDFYLPNLDLYLEVKGYFSNKDKKKIKAVLDENAINLLIIHEAELNDPNLLGLIIKSSSIRSLL